MNLRDKYADITNFTSHYPDSTLSREEVIKYVVDNYSYFIDYLQYFDNQIVDFIRNPVYYERLVLVLSKCFNTNIKPNFETTGISSTEISFSGDATKNNYVKIYATIHYVLDNYLNNSQKDVIKFKEEHRIPIEVELYNFPEEPHIKFFQFLYSNRGFIKELMQWLKFFIKHTNEIKDDNKELMASLFLELIVYFYKNQYQITDGHFTYGVIYHFLLGDYGITYKRLKEITGSKSLKPDYEYFNKLYLKGNFLNFKRDLVKLFQMWTDILEFMNSNDIEGYNAWKFLRGVFSNTQPINIQAFMDWLVKRTTELKLQSDEDSNEI